MAIPNLSPASTSNANILPVTGAAANVGATLPFGIYAASNAFLSGASDQVAYTYKKLGGDVLDIELAEGNVSQSRSRGCTQKRRRRILCLIKVY